MLPYHTVPEAEAALGQRLTCLESLWLDYSADKPDYFLYCHTIVFLFLIFSIVPLPFILAEVLNLKGFHRYKIQPNVRLSLRRIVGCYKDVMTMFFLVVGPLQLVSYPSVKRIGITTGLPLPSIWEILSQLLVYFLIEDYCNYWLHRWLHHGWGYEKIHKVHHEFTAPIAFAAPYAHWAEVLILGIPTFLGPAIVPCHMITLWLWIALRQIEAIDTHKGYEMPWSITKLIPFYGGADYHDYHHFVGGQSQGNFASVFTYCDFLYGTDKGYRYHKKTPREDEGRLEKSNSAKTRVMGCLMPVLHTYHGLFPSLIICVAHQPYQPKSKGNKKKKKCVVVKVRPCMNQLNSLFGLCYEGDRPFVAPLFLNFRPS